MATKTNAKATASRTIRTKAAQALEIAREAFARTKDATEFWNALFGVGAPFGQLFPTQAEREAFGKTDESRQIEEMLEQLQGEEGEEPASPADPQARFVLRLPRSLYEALKAEARTEGVSVNMLCVTKLATKLRTDLLVKC